MKNRIENSKETICPVCGFNGLEEEPWSINLTPSWDICPCCGIEFGNDDFGISKEEIMLKQINLREKWISNGMKWKHNDENSIKMIPKNWDPREQLRNII